MKPRARCAATAAAFLLIVAGCSALEDLQHVPPVLRQPIGQVFENPDGGPPIECRDVPKRPCIDARRAAARADRMETADIVRIIVTCPGGQCRDDAGSAEISVLLEDGTVQSVGTMTYSADWVSRSDEVPPIARNWQQ